MNLSPHFTLEEMVESQTASRMGIDNTPPPVVLENLYELAGALEEVRSLLGRPIIISSGYRSAKLNAAIGGSASSAHMRGLAVDFVSPPATPLQICKLIEASSVMFDQLIHEHTWVHLAIGPQNRRQILTLRPLGGYETGL